MFETIFSFLNQNILHLVIGIFLAYGFAIVLIGSETPKPRIRK